MEILTKIIRYLLRPLKVTNTESILNPSYEEIEKKLSETIKRAKLLPAYNGKLDNFDFSDPMGSLKKIPLLDKSEINSNPDLFISQNIKYTEVRTGGSTGQPMIFFQDKESRNIQKRNMFVGRSLWGLDFSNDKCLLFWGHSSSFAPGLKGIYQKIKLRLKDLLQNRTRISAYEINPRNIKDIHAKLLKDKPDYIQGYASVIEKLAILMNEENLVSSFPNLKLIVTTAEPLLEGQKQKIESFFNCPVANEYGCTEIGVLAYSHPDGGMNFFGDSYIVEIDNQQNHDGRLYGDLIITTISEANPILLRYKTGDIAVLKEEERKLCYGSVDQIVGRSHDMIKSKDGSAIHGEFFTHIFENISGIKKFQVIQEDYLLIKIILITDNSWEITNEGKIIKQLNQVLKGRFDLRFFYDEIEIEDSGKFRWIISRVND